MIDRPAIEAVHQMIVERGQGYGDPQAGGKALGKTWAGILSDALQTEIPDLSPRVVYLMMAALKLNRAARPFKFSQDDYVDGIAYLHLAENHKVSNDKT